MRKIGSDIVKEAAEHLYSDLRHLFAYKRKDCSYAVETGLASIKTPEFALQVRIDQSEVDPKSYLLTIEVLDIFQPTILEDKRFHVCFTKRCDQLCIEWNQSVNIEAMIDAIEAHPELAGCLQYQPDGSAFELKLADLDLHIDINEERMLFSLLTRPDLEKLLSHSQKTLDIFVGAAL